MGARVEEYYKPTRRPKYEPPFTKEQLENMTPEQREDAEKFSKRMRQKYINDLNRYMERRPDKADTSGIDRFRDLAAGLFRASNPGNWGEINELLSARLKGESESAAKLKGQILQGEMARALSARMAQTPGNAAALAAARTQPMAENVAKGTAQAALARRNEQGEAANTFFQASQKQQALQADYLKMGLNEAQSKLAAELTMEREWQKRYSARRQVIDMNQQTMMNRIGAVGSLVGNAMVGYGSWSAGKDGGDAGTGGGVQGYATEEPEKELFKYDVKYPDSSESQKIYNEEWQKFQQGQENREFQTQLGELGYIPRGWK